jgi:O-antigen ligase
VGASLGAVVTQRLHRVSALGVSWEAVAVALCLPPIFVHVQWQPGIAVVVGGTTANAYLSDFAVAAIVLVALAAGVRRGFAPLAAGRWIWLGTAAFLLWTFAELANGRHVSSNYPLHTHAVTAAKFAEYALLGPAVAVALRTFTDALVALWSLTLWSALATVVGLAQFFGAAIFIHGRLGGRQGSFLSYSDFAALSGAVLVLGLVALVRREAFGRRLAVVATTSGLLGLILAAAVASLIGVATAAVVVGVPLVLRRDLPRGRVLAGLAVAAVAAVGVVALRGGDLASFARFAGSSSTKEKTVQTYAHRTLLVWVGLHIWRDHPLLGAGWEAAGDPETFEPYLAAAHKRFPNEPALAFPTRAHPYNSQNLWVEALADLGVVGLALLVAMFAGVAVVGWRAVRRAGEPAALVGLGWTALVVWLWTAQSFVAGIPLDAVTWLGFGLVAVGAASARASVRMAM